MTFQFYFTTRVGTQSRRYNTNIKAQRDNLNLNYKALLTVARKSVETINKVDGAASR